MFTHKFTNLLGNYERHALLVFLLLIIIEQSVLKFLNKYQNFRTNIDTALDPKQEK